MAVVTPALLDQNLTKVSTVVRSVSSASPSLPSRFLDDQARGKVWRSILGWNFVLGVNDGISSSRAPGPILGVASIVAGNYASGAELATAIVVALEAGDPTPIWACTYDGSTQKFTITSDVAVTLTCNTGSNAATSIWKSIGFNTAADNQGTGSLGLSFVSDNAVTHSIEWVGYDFGAATAITAGIALEHNLGSGSIKVQSSATSIIAAITAPTVTQTLTGDSTVVYKLFASQSHRYVVFFVDDVACTDGFSEMAITYLGTYRAPKAYSGSFSRKRGSLSMGTQATEGALSGDQRPQERAWGLIWKNLESTDVTLFEAFYTATPEYACFFLHLDTTAGTSTSLIYGYRDQSSQAALDTETAGLVYDTSFVFREMLP